MREAGKLPQVRGQLFYKRPTETKLEQSQLLKQDKKFEGGGD